MWLFLSDQQQQTHRRGGALLLLLSTRLSLLLLLLIVVVVGDALSLFLYDDIIIALLLLLILLFNIECGIVHEDGFMPHGLKRECWIFFDPNKKPLKNKIKILCWDIYSDLDMCIKKRSMCPRSHLAEVFRLLILSYIRVNLQSFFMDSCFWNASVGVDYAVIIVKQPALKVLRVDSP